MKAGYGQYTGEFHRWLTSYDTEDPAAMLQLRRSAKLILDNLCEFRATLYAKAVEHKDTLMIARTHGQLAEPDSFGRLLLDFVEACDQAIRRLEYIIDSELSFAKLSGAIGSYAGLDPELERETLRILDLEPVRVSTQIMARDRHSTYMDELATIGGTLQRLAETLWVMSHGLIAEVREPRKAKQKGSSAMPQKRNPIWLERTRGLARLLRGYASSMKESIATPECRDISQSCVERVVFPDATSLVYYLLEKWTKVIEGLEVFPDTMEENLARAYDTWAAQRVKVALTDAGVNPEQVYDLVQDASFKAIETRQSLAVILRDRPIDLGRVSPSVAEVIGPEKFSKLFDPKDYIKNGIDVIYERFAV